MNNYRLSILFTLTCALLTQAIAADLNDATNALNAATNTAKAAQMPRVILRIKMTALQMPSAMSTNRITKRNRRKKNRVSAMITAHITTIRAIRSNTLICPQAYKRKSLMVEVYRPAGRKK
jgi:hypothetical protein